MLFFLLVACGDDDGGDDDDNDVDAARDTGSDRGVNDAPSDGALADRQRNDIECEADSDCVVASDHRQCCVECASAFPRALADADPCLVTAYSLSPAGCEPGGCGGAACPDLSCSSPIRAACMGGRCVTAYTCNENEVERDGRCVPRCATESDCVSAQRVSGCCAGVCQAYPRAVVEAESCLVTAGEDQPSECAPPPMTCAAVDCADAPPCTDEMPVCMDGQCTLSE